MIDWGIVLVKLTSRKFWAMVAGFVTGILTMIFGDDKVAIQIGGLITAFGSLVVYIFAEAIVDKARNKVVK